MARLGAWREEVEVLYSPLWFFHVCWRRFFFLPAVFVLFSLVAITPAVVRSEQLRSSLPVDSLTTALEELQRTLPTHAEEFGNLRLAEVTGIVRTIDERSAALIFEESRSPEIFLASIHRLCVMKQRVDRMLTELLDLRLEISSMPADGNRRLALSGFLQASSALIDLSGRLNYLLRDAIIDASYWFASEPELREKLIEQLFADRSTIGASLMALMLLDPPPESSNDTQPASPATKRKILVLLSHYGRNDILPVVVEYLRSETSPELVVLTADTICRLGLPQDPLPASEPEPQQPPPMITARSLWEVLDRLDPDRLSKENQKRREVLMDWLDLRARLGVGPQGYWVGSFELKPGDWLLMRNPSPYNLFTDLSPGLFTHVGVVALHRGEGGVGRMLMVDLNERQLLIPGENVETNLPLPLYYAVLRHEDPEVGLKMSQVASSLIGNTMEFDLSFDTSRVVRLRGQQHKGRKIETYCAGLLLLCAQETGRPRSEFFPIPERPAGGRAVENMRQIGIVIGDDFISPTGPLFARRMKLVHLSEPMYDPGREIEQRIYDHFAAALVVERIAPRHNLFQLLRQNLADAAKTNPLLAQALARAAGVHPDTDLASAARAMAVVETLDSIAMGNSSEYREAFLALQGEPIEDLARLDFSQERIEHIEELRQRHADLAQLFQQDRLTPHDLNRNLVTHYVERGTVQIDQHFFLFPTDVPAGED